jgi:hypothetical protein
MHLEITVEFSDFKLHRPIKATIITSSLHDKLV